MNNNADSLMKAAKKELLRELFKLKQENVALKEVMKKIVSITS